MWPTFYIPRRRGRYPTPIIVRTVYTTPPYPVEAEDGIESAFSDPSGAFGKFFYPLSTMQSSWSLVTAELRDILQSFDGGMDAVEADWTIISGELRQILRDFDGGMDAAQSSYTILSGSLNRILISYTHPAPDKVESSWTIISGTLT